MVLPLKHFVAGIFIKDRTELNEWVIADRYRGVESIFSMKYEDKIQSVLKHHNWIVWLKQINENDSRYIVDIYTDSDTDYAVIAAIINDNPPEHFILNYMERMPFARFSQES